MKLLVATLLFILASIAAWMRYMKAPFLAKLNLTKVAEVATIISLLLALVVWLFPSSNSLFDSSEPKINNSQQNKDVQLRADFSHIAALRLLFGRDVMILASDSSVSASWHPTAKEANELFETELSSINSRVHLAMLFVEGGTQKYVLVIESIPGDSDYTCHACAPAIGVAIFSRREGVWFLDGFTRKVADIGAWGKTPLGQLIQIGPDEHGIIFYRSSMGQGYANHWFVLLSLNPKNLRVILQDELGANSDGAVEFNDSRHFHSSGFLRFIDNGKENNFDAFVTEVGTKMNDKTRKVESISEQRWYSFNSDKQEFVHTKTTQLSNQDEDPDWFP